jgi:hypothetical protein
VATRPSKLKGTGPEKVTPCSTSALTSVAGEASPAAAAARMKARLESVWFILVFVAGVAGALGN